MRNILFLSLLLLVITSCQDVRKPSKPNDLIPEKKMVNVLIELSLLQGARSYNKQELERRGLKPDEYLWEKFNIDSSQFAKSNNYYARNYVVYQRIYENVRDSLEVLKTLYDSIREQQERYRDSISGVGVREEKGDTLLEEARPEVRFDSLGSKTRRGRLLHGPDSME